MSILGPLIGKNWGFSPLKLLGGNIGDRLFQDILPRVAKFRENRPRDVEKSVDGKNNTTKT